MCYNFEHRDEKGFAIELEDEDGGDSKFVGQVYGSAETFEADNPLGAELQFRSAVNDSLDGEEDDE